MKKEKSTDHKKGTKQYSELAKVQTDPFKDENVLNVGLFSSLHNKEAIITRIQ
jgi:hypothetical protein